MLQSERVIRWIEKHLRIPEGRLVGKPVRLDEWQKDDIRLIYDNAHVTRRAILSFARKNGKTALAAMLLLVHLCGPMARPNSGLYSAAQSRDQAAVLFGLAAKMVRMSPTLSGYVSIRDTGKELYCSELGTLYKALSAEAKTKFGLSPVFLVHDELGQVRGPKSALYTALETATAAQDSPLSIIISTQAATDGDLLSILIDDALSGEDKSVVVKLYTAHMDLPPFDIDTIRQANPAFDSFQNQKEVLAMAADAERMPSFENEYRNLILNQRVESLSPFISRGVWDACNAAAQEDFGDAKTYIGLDLSEVRDLTAKVAVAEINKLWNVAPTFWLPEEGIHERSKNDRVPYDLWSEQGFLSLSPGPTIEYEFVALDLRETFANSSVEAVAFDRYNWRHFEPWLKKVGFKKRDLDKFIPFGQGTKDMSPALRAVEQAVYSRKMCHGGHPVLNMCMHNARVTSKDSAQRKLVKHKSKGRIDGAVALAMAMGVAATDNPTGNSPSIRIL